MEYKELDQEVHAFQEVWERVCYFVEEKSAFTWLSSKQIWCQKNTAEEAVMK